MAPRALREGVSEQALARCPGWGLEPRVVGMVRRIDFVSVLQRLDTAAASALRFAVPLRN